MTTPPSNTAPGGHVLKHPLVEMLQIAAPTVATMTSYTAMHFVDGLMVSRIGPDPVYVAAQGNGGMAAFVPISIVMGVLTMINTYVSQNLGAGRPERGPAYAWNGLWIALASWVLMIPFAVFAVPSLFSLSGHSENLRALETGYAQILLYGSLLTMATRGIAHYFYGMHRPMTVLLAAIVGNLSNVALNYALIYGHFGLPAMGVAGAALATVIGTAIELSIPLAVFLGPTFNRLYRTRAAWKPSLPHIRDLVRIGWPGGLMFGNEMICWTYLMAYLVGYFGEVHNTAGWIALRYMHLAFMPAIGLSIAVTAIVGRCMGMGRPDLAARRAWLGVALTMGYMGLCAMAFVLFRHEAIRVFIEPGTDPAVAASLVAIGAEIMIAAAVFQLFDALGITLIGALRGAGDTVWPGVATVVLSWACIVGGGHLMIEVAPGLGSLGPWIGASAYIVLLGLFVMYRFLSGKWKTIDLLTARERGAVTVDGEPLKAPPDAVAGVTPGSA